MTERRLAKKWHRIRLLPCAAIAALVVTALHGCPPQPQPPVEPPLNTSDPTNGGASYVTAGACSPCHIDITRQHSLHGHSRILTRVFGNPPVFPPQATRAGVPNPPPGLEWDDVSYVVGGYLRKANFLDAQGFLLTDGTAGTTTQWNLAFPPTQTPAGWDSFLPGQATPLPYTFDCFRCHTTGPSREGNQSGLPGIQGSWVQDGVSCEACHGPGSRHVANPPAGIYLNTGATLCGQCHSRQENTVLAAGGFILHEQQFTELQASPHAGMQCVTCHDAHVSPNYDPGTAFINDCQNCHAEQNMALHAGKVFQRGDYTEPLTCRSCHMPFATRSATSVLIDSGRVADVRTHLFRINAGFVDYTAMFTPDGTQLAVGPGGRSAGVTIDFVCLRCHNNQGNAFSLSLSSATDVADDIHEIAQ